MSKSVVFGLLLALLAVAAAVIGARSQPATSQAAPTITPALPSSSVNGTPVVPPECRSGAVGTPEPVSSPGITASPVAAASRLTVEIFDLGYRPCALRIPAGVPVTLTLTNTGTAVGNFIIDKLSIRTPVIQPGSSITIEINAAPGVYEFYSDIPGHVEAGQVGVLIVTAAATPGLATPTP